MKEIVLSRNFVTTVDDEDYHIFGSLSWCVSDCNGKLYVMRKDENGSTLYLHRAITMAMPFEEIDHKDGNSLNNTRENLIRTTHSKNMLNMKDHESRGVTRIRGTTRWRMQLRFGNKVYSEVFKTKEEARTAYLTLKKKLLL